jgi:hypothetical protein
LPGRGVYLGRRAMFRPLSGDETNLSLDETIFAAREDIRKPVLAIN